VFTQELSSFSDGIGKVVPDFAEIIGPTGLFADELPFLFEC